MKLFGIIITLFSMISTEAEKEPVDLSKADELTSECNRGTFFIDDVKQTKNFFDQYEAADNLAKKTLVKEIDELHAKIETNEKTIVVAQASYDNDWGSPTGIKNVTAIIDQIGDILDDEIFVIQNIEPNYMVIVATDKNIRNNNDFSNDIEQIILDGPINRANLDFEFGGDSLKGWWTKFDQNDYQIREIINVYQRIPASDYSDTPAEISGTNELQTLVDDIVKNTGELEGKAKEIEGKAIKIDELNAQISELNADGAKATKLREAEKDQNDEKVKDAQEALAATVKTYTLIKDWSENNEDAISDVADTNRHFYNGRPAKIIKEVLGIFIQKLDRSSSNDRILKDRLEALDSRMDVAPALLYDVSQPANNGNKRRRLMTSVQQVKDLLDGLVLKAREDENDLNTEYKNVYEGDINFRNNVTYILDEYKTKTGDTTEKLCKYARTDYEDVLEKLNNFTEHVKTYIGQELNKKVADYKNLVKNRTSEHTKYLAGHKTIQAEISELTRAIVVMSEQNYDRDRRRRLRSDRRVLTDYGIKSQHELLKEQKAEEVSKKERCDFAFDSKEEFIRLREDTLEKNRDTIEHTLDYIVDIQTYDLNKRHDSKKTFSNKLDASTAEREKERQTYQKTRSSYTNSINCLDQSIDLLKQDYDRAQPGGTRRRLQNDGDDNQADDFVKATEAMAAMIDTLEKEEDTETAHIDQCNRDFNENEKQMAEKKSEINRLKLKIEGHAADAAKQTKKASDAAEEHAELQTQMKRAVEDLRATWTNIKLHTIPHLKLSYDEKIKNAKTHTKRAELERERDEKVKYWEEHYGWDPTVIDSKCSDDTQNEITEEYQNDNVGVLNPDEKTRALNWLKTAIAGGDLLTNFGLAKLDTSAPSSRRYEADNDELTPDYQTNPYGYLYDGDERYGVPMDYHAVGLGSGDMPDAKFRCLFNIPFIETLIKTDTMAKLKEKEVAEAALAQAEQEKVEAEGELAEYQRELEAAEIENSELHSKCDFFVNNGLIRKQARTVEKEALIEAKTILRQCGSSSPKSRRRLSGGVPQTPEAYAYEFHSGGILEMLIKLKETFVEEIHALELVEQGALEAYAGFVVEKNVDIAKLDKDIKYQAAELKKFQDHIAENTFTPEDIEVTKGYVTYLKNQMPESSDRFDDMVKKVAELSGLYNVRQTAETEKMNAEKEQKNLHPICDFYLQKYDVRQGAMEQEIKALETAAIYLNIDIHTSRRLHTDEKAKEEAKEPDWAEPSLRKSYEFESGKVIQLMEASRENKEIILAELESNETNAKHAYEQTLLKEYPSIDDVDTITERDAKTLTDLRLEYESNYNQVCPFVEGFYVARIISRRGFDFDDELDDELAGSDLYASITSYVEEQNYLKERIEFEFPAIKNFLAENFKTYELGIGLRGMELIYQQWADEIDLRFPAYSYPTYEYIKAEYVQNNPQFFEGFHRMMKEVIEIVSSDKISDHADKHLPSDKHLPGGRRLVSIDYGPDIGGIMGIMEVIQSDWSRLISETTTEEEAAKSQYDDFKSNTDTDVAEKKTQVEDLWETRVDLEKKRAELQSNFGGLSKDFDNLKGKILSFKKSLETLKSMFKEVSKANGLLKTGFNKCLLGQKTKEIHENIKDLCRSLKSYNPGCDQCSSIDLFNQIKNVNCESVSGIITALSGFYNQLPDLESWDIETDHWPCVEPAYIKFSWSKGTEGEWSRFITGIENAGALSHRLNNIAKEKEQVYPKIKKELEKYHGAISEDQHDALKNKQALIVSKNNEIEDDKKTIKNKEEAIVALPFGNTAALEAWQVAGSNLRIVAMNARHNNLCYTGDPVDPCVMDGSAGRGVVVDGLRKEKEAAEQFSGPSGPLSKEVDSLRLADSVKQLFVDYINIIDAEIEEKEHVPLGGKYCLVSLDGSEPTWSDCRYNDLSECEKAWPSENSEELRKSNLEYLKTLTAITTEYQDAIRDALEAKKVGLAGTLSSAVKAEDDYRYARSEAEKTYKAALAELGDQPAVASQCVRAVCLATKRCDDTVGNLHLSDEDLEKLDSADVKIWNDWLNSATSTLMKRTLVDSDKRCREGGDIVDVRWDIHRGTAEQSVFRYLYDNGGFHFSSSETVKKIEEMESELAETPSAAVRGKLEKLLLDLNTKDAFELCRAMEIHISDKMIEYLGDILLNGSEPSSEIVEQMFEIDEGPPRIDLKCEQRFPIS